MENAVSERIVRSSRKRKRCRLTQQTLADQCGLAIKTIQDIEGGKKNPSYETLALLIERLGISPNSLFPSTAVAESDPTQRVIGKLQTHSRENQEILLNTMEFLSEQLLSSQLKPELNRSE